MPSESELEDDLLSYSPSTSSSDHNKNSTTLSTVVIGGRTTTEQPSQPPPLLAQPLTTAKPSLFQRLWTDSDEIELLQGFLDYKSQRVGSSTSSYHLDTNLFYDQIKSRLQLDFNKSQLVEKLRRLKKKYRNAVKRMKNGRNLSFKSHHEQAAFQISHKIWNGAGSGRGRDDLNVIGDEEIKPKLKGNGHVMENRSKKRMHAEAEATEVEKEVSVSHNLENSTVVANLIEETVKSCLAPVIKDLFNNVLNGGLGGGSMLNSCRNLLPLGFGGNLNGEVMDEKWRKHQILELQVFAKRIELVQDEIKVKLEELKGNRS